MVKQSEPTAKTEERTLPVCPACDRAFEERDIAWLHYRPKLVCDTDAKWVDKKHSSALQRSEHTSFSDAISVVSQWVVGVCEFCARDTYNADSVRPRSLEQARAAVEDVVPDGGVVNEYRTTYQSTETDVERTYCNKCETDCTDDNTVLHMNPSMKVRSSRHRTVYVDKNWYTEQEPDWSDVTSVQTQEKLHLCNDCFKQLRPSFFTRAKRRLVYAFH